VRGQSTCLVQMPFIIGQTRKSPAIVRRCPLQCSSSLRGCGSSALLATHHCVQVDTHSEEWVQQRKQPLNEV
jgi:hypothetical protein